VFLLDYIMYIYIGNEFHFVEYDSDIEKEYDQKTLRFLGCMEDLFSELTLLDAYGAANEENIKWLIYDVGKRHMGSNKKQLLNDYFRVMYMIWGGREEGPRWDTFICMFGVQRFIDVMKARIDDPWRIGYE